MRATTCIACGVDLPVGLYLYCSPACSKASRRKKWAEFRPNQAPAGEPA
jgi:hypothetical protein